VRQYTIPLLVIVAAQLVPAANAAHNEVNWSSPGGLNGASVVYGTVCSVERMTEYVFRLDVQVEASLGGNLVDPAKTPRLVLEYDRGSMFDRDEKVSDPVPTPKCHVLAFLVTMKYRGGGDGLFPGEVTRGVPFALRWGVSCMPHGSAIARVSGFDDPKVAAVITKIREVLPYTEEMPAHDQPRTYKGDEPGLWKDRSLLYAEVTASKTSRRFVPQVTFDVKATLWGPIDAAQLKRIACGVVYVGWKLPWKLPPEYSWVTNAKPVVKTLPAEGSRVLAIVQQTKDDHIAVSQDYFTFMPDKSPVAEVSGLDDPKVKQVTSRLRDLHKRPPADAPWK